MAAMATPADIETELGRALTSEEAAKAAAALESASDYVRGETGRKWTAGTYTVTRLVRGGKVWLDSPSAVTGVVSVDALGGTSDLTGHTLRGGTLYGLGYARQVEVTYTSDGTVPDELRRVVAAMAARDITNRIPQGATSHTQTSGPFSEATTFDGGADTSEPTNTEARILRRYAARSTLRSVSLL